jgi:hypothetical protein
VASTARRESAEVCAGNLGGKHGQGGVNARHHLLQLPEVEKYMPRFDALVVLMGLNDFLYDLHIHHPIVTPENWLARQAFMSLPGDEGSLAIVSITKRLWKAFRTRGVQGYGVSDFGYYQKHLRDAYAKVSSDRWVRALPELGEHLERYRKTIMELKTYADRKGIPIVFVSQPFVWSANMSDQTKAQIYAGFIGHELDSPTIKWYTPEALEQGLSAYNKILMETCKTEKLHCVDAAAKMPREAPYFYDDFHFSERGAEFIGKTVGSEVRNLFAECKEEKRR